MQRAVLILPVALGLVMFIRPHAEPAIAAGCSGYYSDVNPPSTIRIYHNNPLKGPDYQIYTRDFKTYAKESHPHEWNSGWAIGSLQAGAMAVRNYAWYWVNRWRGGWANGQCYDVDSSTSYQAWAPCPGLFCWRNPNTDEAVDSVWNARITWNEGAGGQIFESLHKQGYRDQCGQYNGGQAPGNDMSQYGSAACASQGEQWGRILQRYYFSQPLVLLDEGPAVTEYYQGGDGYHLQVYAIGRDAALWEKFYSYNTGQWYGWGSQGGFCSGTPPATASTGAMTCPHSLVHS